MNRAPTPGDQRESPCEGRGSVVSLMRDETRDRDGYPEDPLLRAKERRLEELLGAMPRAEAPRSLRADVMAELRATPPGLMLRLRRRWARLGRWRVPLQLAPVAALALAAIIGHQMWTMKAERTSSTPSSLSGVEIASLPAPTLQRGVKVEESQARLATPAPKPAPLMSVAAPAPSPSQTTEIAQASTVGMASQAAQPESVSPAPPARREASEAAGAFPRGREESSEEPRDLTDETESGTVVAQVPEHGLNLPEQMAPPQMGRPHAETGEALASSFSPAPAESPAPATFFGSREETHREPAQNASSRQPLEERRAPSAGESGALTISSHRIDDTRILPPPPSALRRPSAPAAPAASSPVPGALAFNGETGVTADQMRAAQTRAPSLPQPPQTAGVPVEHLRCDADNTEEMAGSIETLVQGLNGFVTQSQPVTTDRRVWRVMVELPRWRMDALRQGVTVLANPQVASVASQVTPPSEPRELSPHERQVLSVEILIYQRHTD
jgi:hypothetical protein